LLKANTFWSILFLHFGNFLRLLQLVNVVSNRSDCLFKFQPNVNHSTGLLLTELDTNNCRAMLFKRAYAVMRCLSARVSVRPSVCHVRGFCRNESSKIFFTLGQPHPSSFSVPNVMAIFRCGPP